MMMNMQFHEGYETSLIPVRPEKPSKPHKGKSAESLRWAGSRSEVRTS